MTEDWGAGGGNVRQEELGRRVTEDCVKGRSMERNSWGKRGEMEDCEEA